MYRESARQQKRRSREMGKEASRQQRQMCKRDSIDEQRFRRDAVTCNRLGHRCEGLD